MGDTIVSVIPDEISALLLLGDGEPPRDEFQCEEDRVAKASSRVGRRGKRGN